MVITYYCIVTLFIIAYLLGSIPSAVWIGTKYYGVDVREHGSKNAGTTNVLRVLGVRAALPVFVIDFLKGFIAVSIFSLLKYDDNIPSQAWIINMKILAVFVVTLGHIFPIFAKFKGGKGVATVLGAVTGIQPNIALLCFAVWFVVFMVWHYVSLASIVAGCAFPVFVSIFSGSIYARHGLDHTSISFLVFSFVVAIALVWTHRKNIGRILDAAEPKVRVWEYLKLDIIDKDKSANG
ncbi:MAG: glycerol-3-phosphate 1-O-acyltransferase PlsY [Rikenellaceae bacterium]|nr:glycerol-3-phosphate 1-O-acyltransferase PlsY [Rikenellaceae bacterium]